MLSNFNAFNQNLMDMLRVHIVAVGFEVDRIVLPAIEKKADRVWLIVHNQPHEDKGNVFVDLIKKRLEDVGIDCRYEYANRTDLFDTLRTLKLIISKESKNSILINVSVGSKIQAIASMMICMMFKDQVMIKPYYVVPKRYNTSGMQKKEQETEGMQEIIPLPEYKIEIPKERLVKCMHIINQQNEGMITKRALKDLAIQNNLIHITSKRDMDEYSEQAAYMALNKNLIEPLLEWNFISVTKQGAHHMVALTNEGKNALRFLNIE